MKSTRHNSGLNLEYIIKIIIIYTMHGLIYSIYREFTKGGKVKRKGVGIKLGESEDYSDYGERMEWEALN